MKRTLLALLFAAILGSAGHALLEIVELTPAVGTSGGWTIDIGDDSSHNQGEEDQYCLFFLEGYSIPTGSAGYVQIVVDGVYHWDHVDSIVTATSGDSITTMNAEWLSPNDTVIKSQVITIETPLTWYRLARLRLTIYNPSANVETGVTLSVGLGNE